MVNPLGSLYWLQPTLSVGTEMVPSIKYIAVAMTIVLIYVKRNKKLL